MSATDFYRYAGGNTANVAIGLARLGVDVKLIAKIGVDFHGQYLKELLAAEGVDVSYLVEDARYHTAQCYMTVADDGSPVYRNWPKPHAADMLGPEDVNEAAFADARFLHSTGISLVTAPRRQAVMHGIELCKSKNIVVSFDACFPTGQGGDARDAALTLMAQCHLLKMNLAELSFWSGMAADTDMNLMVEEVGNFASPVALVVTLGAEGAMLYTPAGKIYCPPRKVSTVCDVGAGDAFMAGMIYALASKLPVKETCLAGLKKLSAEEWAFAGNTGSVCGALSTLAIGATETFPRLKELQGMLSAST